MCRSYQAAALREIAVNQFDSAWADVAPTIRSISVPLSSTATNVGTPRTMNDAGVSWSVSISISSISHGSSTADSKFARVLHGWHHDAENLSSFIVYLRCSYWIITDAYNGVVGVDNKVDSTAGGADSGNTHTMGLHISVGVASSMCTVLVRCM